MNTSRGKLHQHYSHTGAKSYSRDVWLFSTTRSFILGVLAKEQGNVNTVKNYIKTLHPLYYG